MSAVTAKIRSKGHWDVTIRPEPFIEHRVGYADLDEILSHGAVRLRGWPVPFIENREEPLRGADWIGQELDADIVCEHEAWRFFTSGQFNHLRAVSADWRTGSEATAVPAGFEWVIEVWEILYYVTEIFELAARLASSAAGDDRMTVDIGLNKLSGRALVVGDRRRAPFMTPRRTDSDTLNRTVTISRSVLVADARKIAVETAREFFLRFGWKPSTDQLASHQRQLTDES